MASSLDNEVGIHFSPVIVGSCRLCKLTFHGNIVFMQVL